MRQHPVHVETFEENAKRVEECKKYLHYHESIVCVAHSRTIHTLSGEFIPNLTGIEVSI
jgi:broad specificity phosphatase PhoE